MSASAPDSIDLIQRGEVALLLFFALTLFHSALLLFLVQPMVGKMILPDLGGTPAVWNTCMVFFQAALLAGYAYAHGSVAWLGVRRQAGLHLVFLLLPLLVLPIAIDTSSVPTSADNPIFWLLGRLVIGVGLPFLVVSTNAPIFQMWFSQTGHRAAKDPYFLYAASNLGSLVALLGYPLIVEPLLPLADQTWAWAGGYGLLIVMAAVCAVMMWRSRAEVPVGTAGEGEALGAVFTPQEEEPERMARPTALRRLRWIALAFVPSSLMLGVTTHVTTEIAPVPLLWVVPLALYLLSFVLVFASREIVPHHVIVRVFPFLIVVTALTAVQGQLGTALWMLPVHLVAFFVTAMLCHGELAKDRPSTRHLTQFYLLISVGGVLGGAFNALVAPLIFLSIAEYPLVMVLACLMLVHRSREARSATSRILDVALPVVVAGVAVGTLHLCYKAKVMDLRTLQMLVVLIPAFLCLLMVKWPLRFALALGACVLGVHLWYDATSEEVLYASRNFYGVKEVKTDEQDHFRTFVHGSTVHGIQSTHPKGREIPRTYFHPTGPVGDVFALFNARSDRSQVGVIGLGVGSMASPIYAHSDQHFTFYEIDPEVARIALNPKLFTYLDDCPAECDIVLGDGRLTLARAPNRHYGILFLDAFSSDAVPTHLLTREALALYLTKLNDRGLLVFNVSNRYLDMVPLLGNLAGDAGLICVHRADEADTEEEKKAGKFSSGYVVMGRQMRDVQPLLRKPGWTEVKPNPAAGVWTDQYTNILGLLLW